MERTGNNIPKIQDFLIDTEDVLSVEEAKEKKASKKRKNVEYNILVENGLDLVIERKTARTTQIAAFILSKGQFYIKKDGTHEEMTADNLTVFLKDSEDIILSNTSWIKALKRGKGFAEDLTKRCFPHKEFIKSGLFYYAENNAMFHIDEMKTFYDINPKLSVWLTKFVLDFYGYQIEDIYEARIRRDNYPNAVISMVESISFLTIFEAVYGLDNTRKFIEFSYRNNLPLSIPVVRYLYLLGVLDPEFENKVINANSRLLNSIRYYRCGREQCADIKALAEMVSSYYANNNVPKFEFNCFKEYLSSYQREGYYTLDNFIIDWKDTLALQRTYFEKIKDKYPENLTSSHNRMALKVNLAKTMIEKRDFEKHAGDALPLEWSNDKYIIVAPKSVSDVINEAVAQNNCLKTYVSRIGKGETRVVFLRKKKQPEETWISIEVYPNGEIVQAKGYQNRNLTQEEENIILEWAKNKNLCWKGHDFRK